MNKEQNEASFADQLLALKGRLLRGDRTALQELLATTYLESFHLASGIVLDSDRAARIVDAASPSWMRRLERLGADETYRLYAYRAGANLAFHQLRRANPVPGSFVQEPSPVQNPSPAQESPPPPGAATVEARLARLHPSHRATLILRSGLGCGYEEIAAILGFPAVSVGPRLHEARRAFLSHSRTGEAGDSAARCGKAADLLDPLVDGEINGADAHWMKAHLESCVACRDEIEELRSAEESLRNLLGDREPAPEIVQGIAARLAAAFPLAEAQRTWRARERARGVRRVFRRVLYSPWFWIVLASLLAAGTALLLR